MRGPRLPGLLVLGVSFLAVLLVAGCGGGDAVEGRLVDKPVVVTTPPADLSGVEVQVHQAPG